jgi:Ca-activated chloride channel family protein
VKFNQPYWLLVGLLVSITLIWAWRRYDARQRGALARFVAPHLRRELTRSVSRLGRITQRGLFLAAVVCLCVALAGPLLGYHWEQISRRGNEVVFAIDTSRSMETPDVKPNRLTRAKLAVDDMARQLDGDAIGIVAFAGSAFLVCPLTLDYGAFHESLDAVDVHTIPRGGTNISSAIQEAQTALRRHPDSDKTLILLTDGEDLEGSAVTAAAAAAKQDGLKIYTIGVGTAAGDLIPVPPGQGGGFVKDENGAFVRSHLDEDALQAIAKATGGMYAPLGAQGEGLDEILRRAFGGLEKHDLAFRQQRVYNERYQWPLAASLVLPARGRNRGRSRPAVDIADAGSIEERRSGRAPRREGTTARIQRGYLRLSRRPVPAGHPGFREVHSSRTRERCQAPRRSRGRLLQSRQFLISRGTAVREVRTPGSPQEVDGRREGL